MTRASMKRHVSEPELALYASGDLPFWQRIATRLHVRQCDRCRGLVTEFRADTKALRDAAEGLPQGLDWARLSAEMTANIRVGLAAGECVAPRRRVARAGRSIPGFVPRVWRPIALACVVTAALAVLLGGGWWLNTPEQDTQALSRAMRSIWNGRGAASYDRRPVIEASSDGVELREGSGSLGVSQNSARLMTVSLSTQGSASAHYVDQDTGQVTVTSVYVP